MRSHNPTILLVEDDENDALFLRMALKDAGVQNSVQVARDGEQALDYLNGTGAYAERGRHPLPYLVLLDLKLPHVMGLDVLKSLRKKAELASVIVIVLTASTNPSDVDSAYKLGANAYLVKPTSFEELQVIARCIKEFWLERNEPGTLFSGLRVR